jgi:hypothetical protein
MHTGDLNPFTGAVIAYLPPAASQYLHQPAGVLPIYLPADAKPGDKFYVMDPQPPAAGNAHWSAGFWAHKAMDSLLWLRNLSPSRICLSKTNAPAHPSARAFRPINAMRRWCTCTAGFQLAGSGQTERRFLSVHPAAAAGNVGSASSAGRSSSVANLV